MVLPALLEADAKDEQSYLRAMWAPPRPLVYSIKSPQINCRYALTVNELKSFRVLHGPASAETVHTSFMRCCIEPKVKEGSLGAWCCTGNMWVHWEKADTAHPHPAAEQSQVRSQPGFVVCQHCVASKPAQVAAIGVDCTSTAWLISGVK